jgi:transcriptional regulator with XRE-family HTH domain
MAAEVDFLDEFARRLRTERLRLGLSQAQMATAGGVAKATQIGYEQAARKPDAGYLVGLLNADVDLMFLFTGTPKHERVTEDLDWKLVIRILDEVKAWCAKNEVEIELNKRPELLRLLYRYFYAKQHVVPSDVHNLLKLAV